MPNLSRFQVIAVVCVGGLVFLLGAILDILGHFQALDYLQSHWNMAYQFLNSGKTHIVLILVGIGMLGLAILKLLQKPPEPEQGSVPITPPASPPPLQQQEASSSVKNSGNASIVQKFYNQPPPEPPKPKPEPKPPREPRFNFYPSEVGIVHLLEGRDGYSIVQMPQYHHGFGTPLPAFIIEITNRAHEQFTVDYASDVVAELIVRETNMGPLIWLEENRANISFTVGHPATLLLSVYDSGRWVIPRRILRNTHQGYRTVDTTYSMIDGRDEEPVLALSMGGKIILKVSFVWTWPKGKARLELKRSEKQGA